MPSITATIYSVGPATAVYSLAGVGTSWSVATVFALVGASGASITSQAVTNGTTAQITVTVTTNRGPYTGTDGVTQFAIPLSVIVNSVSPVASVDGVTRSTNGDSVSRSGGRG